jgi:hypothetical protein
MNSNEGGREMRHSKKWQEGYDFAAGELLRKSKTTDELLILADCSDRNDFDLGIEEAVNNHEKLLARVSRLEAALKPFAKFACDEPCDCHNCRAREALKEQP